MKTAPNKQQIHRTPKELWHGGLVVSNRVKIDRYGQLPCWEINYQLSGDVYRNWLMAECAAIHRKVDKAMHGINFFGSIMDKGLPEAEVKPLLLKVKSLMQKTHPDKAAGYADEFKLMKQCSDWIKSDVPLPTLAHSVSVGPS